MAYGSVEITEGSGTEIATDTIDGKEFQRFKPAFGTEGNATDVSSTNPLPVDVGSGPFPVTDNSGSLTVDDGGSTISVDDGSGSLTVDGTVAVSSVSGTVSVTAPTDGLPVIGTAAGATVGSGISAATTATTLFAANDDRWTAMGWNKSSATLYLKYGSSASTSSFSEIVPANAGWVMPYGLRYTGVITGVWDSAVGTFHPTEFTV